MTRLITFTSSVRSSERNPSLPLSLTVDHVLHVLPGSLNDSELGERRPSRTTCPPASFDIRLPSSHVVFDIRGKESGKEVNNEKVMTSRLALQLAYFFKKV